MARVVVVLPTATYRAADFLDAAHRLGIEVVVASEEEQALAAQMGERALRLDLCRPEEAAEQIVSLHERAPVDAVVPVDDQGVLPAALAAARLGLPHNPAEAVARTRNKAAQRRVLSEAGLPQPAFAEAGPDDDVSAVARRVGLPCVVKAPSLAASRGVIRADTPDDAATAAQRVRAIVSDAGQDPDAPLVVEGYVPGEEVAVEGLVRGGELSVLAVFDKPDPLEGPYFEETIYTTPSRLPQDALDAVEATVARAVRALGLVEGPVHAELRLAPEPVVLEVAARSIGGLCSRTLTFGLGMSLEEIILRHATGRALGRFPRERTAAGVMMIPIPRAGVLEAVEGREDALGVAGIVGLEVTATVGRPIRGLPEGDRYLGFLFAKTQDAQGAERALREAHGKLRIRIAPVA